MTTSAPAARVGIVLAGFALAALGAVLAVGARNLLLDLPPEEAGGGMQAFGDFLAGAAVFGVLSLAPVALALHWLRPVATFWRALQWLAALLALTAPLAAIVSGPLRGLAGNWALLADARLGFMPLVAPACALAAFFAPARPARLVLVGTAAVDAITFALVVFLRFVLPLLAG